jgi:asparagine synthase (glutamine-hydrolysing)
MCGICGIVRFDGQSVTDRPIQQMMRVMKHRGPDDEGFYVDADVGLGSVRLSILDLSPAGHMPMFSDDGRYVIIHNGEVFNYLELRSQLDSRFSFRSHSDTEVILNSYLEWGSQCLERFNGMFAFVIYDRRDRSMFIARDRFGIKPFYYYADDAVFIFASEIPAVLNALDKTITADDSMIYDFLIFNRTNHTDGTFFKNIKKLGHGCSLQVHGRHLSTKRWYSLREKLCTSIRTPDELRSQLNESMKMYLRSDVPVGACLSGGLDSSTIVSMMHNTMANPHTFSAVYEPGSYGDETPFIRYFGHMLNNMHFVRPTAMTFYNDLMTFIRVQAEPLPGTSAYAEFKVMELAKEFVKVVLVGQGTDEALAGYHYFFGFYFKELFLNLAWIALIRELVHYSRIHKSAYGLKTALFLMLPSALKSRFRSAVKPYVRSDFLKCHQNSSAVSRLLYDSPTLHDSLLDHFDNKFEHHLLWGDKSSMWFSVEARFPFLDHKFIEGVLSLPAGSLIKDGMTKYILREAVTNLVPEPIRLRRDKVGYATPEGDWLRTKKFQELCLDILNSKKLAERGYIVPEKAVRLYQDHLAKKRNVSAEIWKWINLELWFREFIDTK